jgi:hypothetical protein
VLILIFGFFFGAHAQCLLRARAQREPDVKFERLGHSSLILRVEREIIGKTGACFWRAE